MIVGLTGGIGSGKTTIAKLFQQFDTVAVYIADVEAKKLMNSSKVIRKNIMEAFGKEAYKNNELNRPFLANLVFNTKEKLQALNSIVHPVVQKDFQEFVMLNKNKSYIIYESAILFESNSQQQFNFIISVFTDLEERIRRVQKRDKASKTAILDRINNQWKEDKKLLLSNYCIINDSPQETEIQVRGIHKILTKKRFLIL